MGVRHDDQQTLKVLNTFILQRKSNVGKEKELSKGDSDAIKFEFESCHFMQTNKPAIAQLRNFKRFVKLLTTNLVDMYPVKSEYLPAII